MFVFHIGEGDKAQQEEILAAAEIAFEGGPPVGRLWVELDAFMLALH